MMLRRLLALVALSCAIITPAFAQKTKAQLNAEIGVQFPDNTTQLITPLALRTTTQDMINSVMPTAPVTSGNLACFNGTTGLLQDCGVSPNNPINTISALRALSPGAFVSVTVLGYYGAGDGGGGTFVWNSISSAADNAGAIIQPNVGGSGRWIRQTAIANQYTPEMFGAKHDGSNDDSVQIRALMTYLNGLTSGGTIKLSCGITYTGSSISSDGRSMIQLLSKVNISGCGQNSVIKVANNVNTSSALFVWALYTTGTANDVTYEDFAIDMNGANNSCSGTCYHSNAALGIATGNNITVRNVSFINNPGSNDTVFGTNVLPPTVTNLNLDGLYHNNSGDRVNAASSDFSADFEIATNVTLTNARYYNGPSVNGAAFELHGSGVTASNLSVDNYFGCGIIANEPAGTASATNNAMVSNVSCINVQSGLQLYSFNGATNVNVNVSNASVLFLTGHSGFGIDACSQISSTTGTNINLIINNALVYSDTTSNLSNDTSGICVGRWNSVIVSNSSTWNTQGPGIRFIASLNNESIVAVGNNINSPGHTGTTALQAGIVADATSGITLNSIIMRSNSVVGAVRYGIIGAQNATQADIEAPVAPGRTVGEVSWTGTGAITRTATGVGYTGGSGGTVTQATGKTTGVTLNTLSGQITMNNAALASGATASFTVTNSQASAADTISVSISSGATAGAYRIVADAVAAGSFRISLSNGSGGSLSEAVVVNYNVIKGSVN